MDSLRRGGGFIKQSWQMAMEDKDLIKPSIYALIAGFIVTIILAIPIGVISYLLQGFKAGQYVIYVLGAILIATPFILFATIVSTYTATAYHTCLYLWARDVERARQTGQTGEVTAPSPLAAVLP